MITDNVPASVGAYIGLYPIEIQKRLSYIRALIMRTAPRVEESIQYSMPAYHLYGKPLVYYGVAKKHIGFYPTPDGVEHFKEKLTGFSYSKGAIQLPHDQDLPKKLLKEIIRYRVDKVTADAKK